MNKETYEKAMEILCDIKDAINLAADTIESNK